MNKNYLITGVPRSGTSLLTSLMSQNLNSVAFSEPAWLKEVRSTSDNCSDFCANFINKITKLRLQIENENPIHIKTSRINKGLPDNYYHRNEDGEIIVDKNEMPVVFEKKYSTFPFIIKANAQFTSCLNTLIESNNFTIICVVRDPVATIMSWRSLKLPVSRGNVKVAEKYSKDFLPLTQSKNLLEKQIHILDWFFKQYHQHRNKVILIKYESLIAQPSKTLFDAIKIPAKHIPELESKNKNTHYDLTEEQNIKNMLMQKGHYFKKYYDLK